MNLTTGQASEPPNPLPLYRSEAIAARQHASFGTITIIHPIPLTILVGLTIAIVAAGLIVLFVGEYHDDGALHGTLIVTSPAGRSGTITSNEGNLLVSHALPESAKAGATLRLHCPGCGPDDQERSATIREIVPVTDPMNGCALSAGKAQREQYSLLLGFSPPLKIETPNSAPARLEVDLILASKKQSLVQWLFSGPGDTKSR